MYKELGKKKKPESAHLSPIVGVQETLSVLTCLLKSTNDWYLNIDKGKYTAAVFIDLKKAFNAVDHEILLNKLGEKGDEKVIFARVAQQFCN